MTIARNFTVAILSVALAVTLGACGSRGGSADSNGDPGITDTEITLGGTFPFSGPASSYAVIPQAEKAYFKYVNEAKGGVKMGDGKTRKIKFLTEDDGYEPSRTVTAAHKLIEQDKVFALYSTLGTPPNLAIWDYVNKVKVPQVFIASGASYWGSDIKAHPWSIGFQLGYTTEAAIWAEYLKKNNPNAKVAILYANDDFGADYLGAFKLAIKGTGIKVVAEKGYATTDPTVNAQVTNLASSNADIFLNISTPKFAAQAIKAKAQLGWNAQQILSAVSASIATVFKPAGVENAKGIIYADSLKDPSSPTWAGDKDVKQYKKILSKYASNLDLADRNVVFGYASAVTFVTALEQMQKPTRDELMKTVRNLDIKKPPMLIPGIPIKTGPNDGYPTESAQLSKFNGTEPKLIGGIISYEGKTPITKTK